MIAIGVWVSVIFATPDDSSVKTWSILSPPVRWERELGQANLVSH